jgi:hypothetical protein
MKVSDEVLDLQITSHPAATTSIELYDHQYIDSVLENFALSPAAITSDCPIRFYLNKFFRSLQRKMIRWRSVTVFMKHYESCFRK